MKKVLLVFFGLGMVSTEVGAMGFSLPAESEHLSASKYQEASSQFKRGISISELGNESGDYNEKAIAMLRRLEGDKSWRPSGSMVDDAAMQQAANAIGQKVLHLISQRDFSGASDWIMVQRYFTSNLEDVARNELLLRDVQSNLSMVSSVVSGGLPFLSLSTQ